MHFTKQTVICSCLFLVGNLNGSIWWRDFDDMMHTSNQIWQQAINRFDEVQAQLDQSGSALKIEAIEEPDFIKITLNLPNGLQTLSKIDLQAKDLSLEGFFQQDDLTIKVVIADGRVFKMSAQFKSKNAISASRQTILLPALVGNLENTQAKLIQDGKLLLLLPKQNSHKNGWRKIEIK